MNELEKFQELKARVLEQYRLHYPYFQGNWKTFSSQDILNLITLIEENCRQTISEKWVYTHLKPEVNDKLPRKDMLTILCQFVGVSGWDEFVFEKSPVSEATAPEVVSSKSNYRWYGMAIALLMVVLVVVFWTKAPAPQKEVEFKDAFTDEKVSDGDVTVYEMKDSILHPVSVSKGKATVGLEDTKKLVVVSPFYKKDTIQLGSDTSPAVIQLEPDDYAQMLKAFMSSDIKDWQTRKQQLQKILADDVEVLLMLHHNLGVEYFDKQEFSQKLIIPAPSLKKMKIVELEKNKDGKIKFVRLVQE